MDLKKLPNGNYYIVYGMKVYEGTRYEVVDYMRRELEIEPDEIYTALAEMDSNYHNTARFGIFGRFLYSEESK